MGPNKRVVCGYIPVLDRNNIHSASLMTGLEIWVVGEEVNDLGIHILQIAFEWYGSTIDVNKIYKKDFEEHTCPKREYHLKFFRSLVDSSTDLPPLNAVGQYEVTTGLNV